MLPDPDPICSLFHHPCAFLFRKYRQLLLFDRNRQTACFPWLKQRRFRKSRQTAVFLFPPCPGQSYIHLDNFPSGIIPPCILYLHINFHPIFPDSPFQKFHFKRGIRKSISKGEQRFYPKAVKISVAYINPFFILFFFQIAVQITERVRTRIIFIPSGPGCCQPSSRKFFAK